MSAPTPDVECIVLITQLNLDAFRLDHRAPFEIENAEVVRDIVDSVFDPVVYEVAGNVFYKQILDACRFLAMNDNTYDTYLRIGPGRPQMHVQLSTSR